MPTTGATSTRDRQDQSKSQGTYQRQAGERRSRGGVEPPHAGGWLSSRESEGKVPQAGLRQLRLPPGPEPPDAQSWAGSPSPTAEGRRRSEEEREEEESVPRRPRENRPRSGWGGRKPNTQPPPRLQAHPRGRRGGGLPSAGASGDRVGPHRPGSPRGDPERVAPTPGPARTTGPTGGRTVGEGSEGGPARAAEVGCAPGRRGGALAAPALRNALAAAGAVRSFCCCAASEQLIRRCARPSGPSGPDAPPRAGPGPAPPISGARALGHPARGLSPTHVTYAAGRCPSGETSPGNNARALQRGERGRRKAGVPGAGPGANQRGNLPRRVRTKQTCTPKREPRFQLSLGRASGGTQGHRVAVRGKLRALGVMGSPRR